MYIYIYVYVTYVYHICVWHTDIIKVLSSFYNLIRKFLNYLNLNFDLFLYLTQILVFFSRLYLRIYRIVVIFIFNLLKFLDYIHLSIISISLLQYRLDICIFYFRVLVYRLYLFINYGVGINFLNFIDYIGYILIEDFCNSADIITSILFYINLIHLYIIDAIVYYIWLLITVNHNFIINSKIYFIYFIIFRIMLNILYNNIYSNISNIINRFLYRYSDDIIETCDMFIAVIRILYLQQKRRNNVFFAFFTRRQIMMQRLLIRLHLLTNILPSLIESSIKKAMYSINSIIRLLIPYVGSLNVSSVLLLILIIIIILLLVVFLIQPNLFITTSSYIVKEYFIEVGGVVCKCYLI